MRQFIARRLMTSCLVVFGVVTAIFVLVRLTGDPVALMTQPGMSVQDIQELRRYWGLDRPIHEQYFAFLADVAKGEFGISPWQLQPALGLVLGRLPATFLLTGAAMAFALVVALIVGTLAALRRNTLVDRVGMGFVLLGQSVPSFWLGLMLILLFAVNLGWLPSAGYGTPQHLILPMVSLGLFTLARLTRLVRSELLEVFAQDYIRTARSKGLSEWVLLRRHALPNIVIPIITVMALDFGILMGGAVITETIFAWPGVGRLMIQAIEQRDFPILQAGVFIVAVLVVTANFLADLAYAWIDPRIRYG
jgi:ABC-type dipeptide/oligopeptide/nickel transport system permease component